VLQIHVYLTLTLPSDKKTCKEDTEDMFSCDNWRQKKSFQRPVYAGMGVACGTSK